MIIFMKNYWNFAAFIVIFAGGMINYNRKPFYLI